MSQTKIVVIPFKKLLIGAVIAAIIIAFIIFAVIRLGSNSSDNSRNTTKPKSSTVNASASSNIETPLDNADAPKFCPGVYTASILLDPLISRSQLIPLTLTALSLLIFLNQSQLCTLSSQLHLMKLLLKSWKPAQPT